MKKLLLCCCAALMAGGAAAQSGYVPTPENLAARRQFADDRFGIFLHWGLYALLGQGEWVMTNQDIHFREYEKLAGAFSATIFPAVNWSILAWIILIPLLLCITTCSAAGYAKCRCSPTGTTPSVSVPCSPAPPAAASRWTTWSSCP